MTIDYCYLTLSQAIEALADSRCNGIVCRNSSGRYGIRFL